MAAIGPDSLVLAVQGLVGLGLLLFAERPEEPVVLIRPTIRASVARDT
ncbi:MAG: hypothetical protein ACR2OE_03575 [Thermomicrobiales bacterium]